MSFKSRIHLAATTTTNNKRQIQCNRRTDGAARTKGDRSNFQEMLKRVCTAESCQTEIVKLQESISNAYAMAEAPTLRNTKSSPKADTSRQKSQRLPVCPLSLKIGLSGKIPPPAKIRLINKKSLLIPTKIASS